MKKLTAGIFTVLMGLVTVNAAEAAVASKGYVDEVAKAAAANVTALEQTVGANKTAAEDAIAAAKKASEDALAAYKETNDAAVAKNADDIAANAQSITNVSNAVAAEKTAREEADTALDGRLDTAEGSITTLQGEVAALSGDGENSVATQIANALTEANDYTDTEIKELTEGAVATNAAAISAMDAAYKAADTQTLADAKAYADGLDSAQKTAFENADKAINDKIGTVAEGKTVVQMIEAAQTAATYDDAEVRGLITDNASDISDNAAAIATKLTDTTKISEDGVYVLTAVTVGDDTTYAWELITRETGTEQE